MSYTRGDYYIWSDDSRVHLWATDGNDNWEDSIWHSGIKENDKDIQPSGVAIPVDVIDEFAVMKVAELLGENKLAEVVSRATEKWKGNGGCIALIKFGDQLKQLDNKIKRPAK